MALLLQRSPKSVNERKIDPLLALVSLLLSWLQTVHEASELRFVRPPSFILDHTAVKKLSMVKPSLISEPHSVTNLLGQSEEWERNYAAPIFRIISSYKPVKSKKSQKVQVEEESGSSEDEEPVPKRRAN
ncbi:hypothetical protein C8J57DRAFT_1715714 [Mycena rebaudengoi]|nr:hypothetical protein C8J57DRAFT_1715714 [Mycena rebaudengoi]